jgi:primosomal protein N' (replication factor Y)
LRAQEEKAALILGSSEPTVEAFYRAKKGRYLIDLGTEARKPLVTLADSRKYRGIICRPLMVKIKEKLEKKEPVLLFFNRRGYASYLLCAKCGFLPRCARCDLALSYHKKEGKLVCHYCRYSVPLMEACPQCGSRLIGRRGVGIEAVAEELRKAFPQNRIEIFAADEAGGKQEKAELIRGFIDGKIDLLVGTQLLVHQANFPFVSFIGILHPEMMLNLADFRSGQKTYEAVTRSLHFLRDDEKAEALIQTAAPGHFSIREAARGDYQAFYDQEIKFRRLMDDPPFSCLAEVFFLGENLRKVAEKSRTFAERVRNSGEDIKIFGPSLASVAKVRGLNRVQLSLKARKRSTLNRILAAALQGISLRKSIFLFG